MVFCQGSGLLFIRKLEEKYMYFAEESVVKLNHSGRFQCLLNPGKHVL